MNKKIDKLKKQLHEAQEMYQLIGTECQQASEKGWSIQLKSAQSRSLSLANKISKINRKIQEEKIN